MSFRSTPLIRLLSWTLLLVGSLLVLAERAPTRAQDFPSRPITMVVGFGAGGSNDLVARIFAEQLSSRLGVPVPVENRPGANSAIALEYVARSKPDGHTIAIAGTSALAINPHTQEQTPYDVDRDFIPVASVASSTSVFAVHPSLPVKTLPELAEFARQQGSLSMAGAGVGGIVHLGMELFARTAKFNLIHAPHAGGVQAGTSVAGGHIQSTLMDLSPLLPMIRGGQLRAIAVASDKRSDLIPDVPTSVEQGFPDLRAVTFYGFVVPAGTPRPIVDRLYTAFTEAARSPEARQKLSNIGAEPLILGSPEEFREFIARERERWGAIARQAGLAVR